MRQYGALRGNPYDSDREFLAVKARAIEDREADRLIAEQLQCGCDMCVGASDDYGSYFDPDLEVRVVFPLVRSRPSG